MCIRDRYQSYIAPVLSNPSLEYLHLKPEFPEDAEALQLLPEILRIKKEHPAAYEIEAAALLSLLWCRLCLLYTSIGSNVVIGAGSVVTKDIPDWSVAVGNPCRVVKKITEEDKQYYFKDRKFDDEAWEVIKDL